jgi:hypothetical protein
MGDAQPLMMINHRERGRAGYVLLPASELSAHWAAHWAAHCPRAYRLLIETSDRELFRMFGFSYSTPPVAVP